MVGGTNEDLCTLARAKEKQYLPKIFQPNLEHRTLGRSPERRHAQDHTLEGEVYVKPRCGRETQPQKVSEKLLPLIAVVVSPPANGRNSTPPPPPLWRHLEGPLRQHGTEAGQQIRRSRPESG